MIALTPNADGWALVGAVTDFAVGSACVLRCNNLRIALFRTASGWYAIKDSCPHAGEPLSRGSVQDDIVTCPGHNWRFALANGQCVRGHDEQHARTYAVEIRGEEIFVKV